MMCAILDAYPFPHRFHFLFSLSKGWGIGGQRELTPEEFARGDRSYFEGYKPQQQGDFLNSIREDQDMLEKSQMEELLGVAKAAGITVKDPSKRLNKFEADVFAQDDDDDLDLSV